MRVIFLDIDGVLNSTAFVANARQKDPTGGNPADDIDPALAAKLDKLVAQTNSQVVLSSDWRKDDGRRPGFDATQAALREHGLGFELYDATPELSERERRDFYDYRSPGSYTPRGLEIQRWLDLHPETGAFVILDDEPDMEHLADRLVQTDPDAGLSDDDCAKTLGLFGKRND